MRMGIKMLIIIDRVFRNALKTLLHFDLLNEAADLISAVR